MGQYYLAVNIDKNEYLDGHDFGSGAKLMEHSWFENSLLKTVNKLISPQGHWHMDRIVSAGDYADKGLFVKEPQLSLYDLCDDEIKKIKPEVDIKSKQERYLLNHTLKEFVDTTKLPNNNGWIVHPLSLLTSSGNGRGGGDFRPVNEIQKSFIGAWAGHSISSDDNVPEGFTEIIPGFFEGR